MNGVVGEMLLVWAPEWTGLGGVSGEVCAIQAEAYMSARGGQSDTT